MTAQTRIILIYVITILVGRIISQRQRKIERSLSSPFKEIIRDRSALFVAISAVIAISLPVIEASLTDKTGLQIYIRMLGLTFVVVGWGVARLGNQAIAGNWSPNINKDKGQKLISSGIYAIVRHPLYLAGIIIIIGTNIYFLSSWSWIGTIVGILAISIRIPIEEKRLVESFGEEYVSYQKRTKAILPMIL